MATTKARRTRFRLTKEAREARNKARWEIIQAANRIRMANRYSLQGVRLYGMKDLQRAVYVCRQFMAVPGRTLIEAGFQAQPIKSSNPQPKMLRRFLGQR